VAASHWSGKLVIPAHTLFPVRTPPGLQTANPFRSSDRRPINKIKKISSGRSTGTSTEFSRALQSLGLATARVRCLEVMAGWILGQVINEFMVSFGVAIVSFSLTLWAVMYIVFPLPPVTSPPLHGPWTWTLDSSTSLYFSFALYHVLMFTSLSLPPQRHSLCPNH
jgi:hypothetical protein